MKASVRLIGMTAPIHDAEALASPDGELGIDNLVKFAESLDPDITGWRFIDVVWFVQMLPLHTREFCQSFHEASIVVKAAETVADGFDAIVIKSSMSALADTFMDAQYDPAVDGVCRAVLATMWEMLAGDFDDVFGKDTDPRLTGE